MATGARPGINAVQIVQVALDLSSVMQQVGRRRGQAARAFDTACVPLPGHWSVWRRRRRRRRLRAARLRPRLRLRRSGFRQSLSRVQHTMRRRRRRTWRAARPRGTMTTEAGPASLIWPLPVCGGGATSTGLGAPFASRGCCECCSKACEPFMVPLSAALEASRERMPLHIFDGRGRHAGLL